MKSDFTVLFRVPLGAAWHQILEKKTCGALVVPKGAYWYNLLSNSRFSYSYLFWKRCEKLVHLLPRCKALMKKGENLRRIWVTAKTFTPTAEWETTRKPCRPQPYFFYKHHQRHSNAGMYVGVYHIRVKLIRHKDVTYKNIESTIW